MTFQQLEYIVEIANCGSINKAATKLFVSQSSVSTALHQLEEELHTPLFTRSNSGVTPTDAGREFISYAVSTLERKSEIEQHLFTRERKKERIPRFSVSSQHYQCASSAFVQYVNRPGMEKYRCSYYETSMDGVINAVADGRADVGIIAVSNISQGLSDYYLSKQDLAFHEIADLMPCAFCAKTHALAERRVLHLEDLYDYPYITFSHNQDLPIDFSEGVNKLALYNHKRRITVNDRSAMINFLCNTDGLSTGSGLIVDLFSDPRMISIPLEDSGEVMHLGWIVRQEQEPSESVKIYLDLLKETVQQAIEHTKTIWDKSWPQA